MCDLPKPHSILSDISISEDDVFQALTSLDPSKASGCDGIGSKLLKHCALALYQTTSSSLLFESLPSLYSREGVLISLNQFLNLAIEIQSRIIGQYLSSCYI